MNSLLETLYHFALETRAPHYLDQAEYADNDKYSRSHLSWLEAHLGAEEKKHLEEYSTMRELADSEEQVAAFCAGLSLGLELSRL